MQQNFIKNAETIKSSSLVSTFPIKALLKVMSTYLSTSLKYLIIFLNFAANQMVLILVEFSVNSLKKYEKI